MARGTHRQTAQACAVFVFTLGLFSVLCFRGVLAPGLRIFTAGLAHSAGAVLGSLGTPVRVDFKPGGGVFDAYALAGTRATLGIADDCNGAWAFAIFVSAVLAVPSTWRAKAWGLGCGLPALWALNMFRVVSLYYIAVFFPDLFLAAHLYVWQFLIIGAALLLLAVWVEYSVAPAHA
jgi:exosortase/archaeosortase family protein